MFGTKNRCLVTLIVAGSLIGMGGCAALGSEGGSDEGGCGGGKCDHATPEHDLWSAPFEHRWALDLSRVRKNVGHYTERVVAATREEIALPDALWGAACQPERIVTPSEDEGYTGEASGVGGCYLWGNMQTLNYDHSRHDDSANVLINIVDDSDGDGFVDQHIDPPGYMNIIALKNTERTNQDELHAYLRNGDILVYFHPEDDDTFQFRMHHAAMYYDTHEYDGDGGPIAMGLGDDRYVHHVDNPVSYGPAFNAGVRSVPFHVYRFNPNGAVGTPNRDDAGQYQFRCTESTDSELCGEDGHFSITDEMARMYAYQARNWALVTNDNAPFSSFHRLTWLDEYKRGLTGVSFMDHVDEFAQPLVGGQTPEVYCAGLVYTNLNLGLNRPMNEAGLGETLWAGFQGQTYDYSDNYMDATFSAEQLQGGVGNLRTAGQLMFDPTPASGIIDGWLEGYFRNFDASFSMLAAGAQAGDEGATAQIGALLEQFQLPPTILTGLGAEQVGAILAQSARGGVLKGAAGDIAGGFSQLREQANKGGGAEGQHAIATPERVEQYAMAYMMGFELELTEEQQAGLMDIATSGLPMAAVTRDDGATVFMGDRFTIGFDASRPAGERLSFAPGPDGQADLLQIKQAEIEGVENRYVPPPMYHWLANRPGSVISYVGTVFHVDLLHPLTDDADRGDGEVNEFAEGGPDSSLYQHYFVPNGGRHVQRILDVNAGPELVGPGSEIMARISAANINDVRVVLHPAGTFNVTDRYLCDDRGRSRFESGEINTDCIALDTKGIALQLPAASGADAIWSDQSVRWNLFAPLTEGGAGCVVEDDGRRTCPAFDWSTNGASESERFELGAAHGMWTITVLDVGAETAGADVGNCIRCGEGGAHSNQWFIKVRDDAPPPETLPALLPNQVWSREVPLEETLIRRIQIPDDFEGGNAIVRLTTMEGDADLTVRDMDSESLGESSNGGATEDVVTIEGATAGAMYQVEIYGYERSSFDLVVELQGATPARSLVDVLNTADYDELRHRAGVAPSPARIIIAGRTEEVERDATAGGGMRPAGPWTSLDELVDAKGVAGGTASALEAYARSLAAGAS